MPAGIYNSFLTADLQNLLKGDKALSNAIMPALGISGLGSPTTGSEAGFFGFDSLGRVDESFSPDLVDMLISARKAKDIAFRGDPQAAGVIQGLRGQVAASDNVDPNLAMALERRRRGLDGLTAPELQGLREQGTEGINRQLQTALRGARVGSLSSGVEGNINAIPVQNIAREAIQGRRGLERDILLANVAERNKRLSEFEGLAGNIDANRFARRSTALDQLGQFSQQNTALSAGLKQNSLNTLSGVTNTARNDLLNRRLFNLNQLAKEKSGQLGLLFGTLGFASQNEAQKKSFELAKQQLDIARQAANRPLGM